jgi:predicted cupin superfamily sugar epimerase
MTPATEDLKEALGVSVGENGAVTALSDNEIIALLGLEPLPHEGGMWAQTWIDDQGTGIYFLMRPGDPSKLHRLSSPELWHYYMGAPARLLLLHRDGTIERRILGADLAAGQRPCVAVPPGTWMAAETTGARTLVGTTMAPPYSDAGFELGDRQRLLAEYPGAADAIVRLTPQL